jgi:hypothetical protein
VPSEEADCDQEVRRRRRQGSDRGRLSEAMTNSPETQYTRSADGTNLAYHTSGDGPLELVFVPAPVPIDLLSDDPPSVRLRRRLEAFSRTVWFDVRGMGASEGDPRAALVGHISDADLTAVVDAVGFERPALAGTDGDWPRSTSRRPIPSG